MPDQIVSGDFVKVITNWLNDFETTYKFSNWQLSRKILIIIKKEVDKMMKMI